MDWTHLMEVHGGYERSAILHAAVKLDLFTRLATLEGRTSGLAVPAPAVAQEAGTEPRATELLMNALVTMGLLTKEPPEDSEDPLGTGGFRTTETAQEFLVEGAPHDFRGFIRFDAENRDAWHRLADTVKRGQPEHLDHMHQSDADGTKRFIDAMEAIGTARGDVEALVDRIDLTRAVHLLDVGGGSAAYSIAWLKAQPHLHVTLVDLPTTLEVTKTYVAKAPQDVQDRIRLVACDYNQDDLPRPPPTSSLPDDLVERLNLPKELLPKLSEGYDVAWVSNIVHGENETNNRGLAHKLHDVLRPGGRVILKEHVTDPTLTQPPVAGIFGVTMLLFTRGGRVYSFDEIRRWYEDAGFVNLKEEPPRAPLTSSLAYATKPGGGLHEELGRAAKLLGESVSGFLRSISPKAPPPTRTQTERA